MNKTVWKILTKSRRFAGLPTQEGLTLFQCICKKVNTADTVEITKICKKELNAYFA